MPIRQFANNASSLTASLISAIDGQVTLSVGDGARFPTPSGANYAMCTLEDVSGNLEIVKLTARSGDLCTIIRGQKVQPRCPSPRARASNCASHAEHLSLSCSVMAMHSRVRSMSLQQY
jgi:hypothetical protein